MAIEHSFKFLVGILFLILAVYLLVYYGWDAFLILLKGAVPIGLAFIGLIFLLLSFEK